MGKLVMPRLCEPCRKHYADDALAACPECGGKVKFTLLPPPGEDAPPMAGVPTKPTGRYGNNPDTGDEIDFEPNLISLTVGKKNVGRVVGISAVLLVAGLFASWLVSADRFNERAAKLKVGMRADKAFDIMDAEPHDEEYCPNDPDQGAATWEGGTKSVSIRYSRGYVTSVEYGTAKGGLYRKITVCH